MIDRFYTKVGNTYSHGILSNFWQGFGFYAPHFDGGKEAFWRSVEHYYQAAKADNWADAESIRLTRSPDEAKDAGRALKRAGRQRIGWPSIKIAVMRRAYEHKFAPGTPEAAYLVSTAGHSLVEGNDWNDQFWGVFEGRGENWAGFCLMAQRSWLQAEKDIAG